MNIRNNLTTLRLSNILPRRVFLNRKTFPHFLRSSIISSSASLRGRIDYKRGFSTFPIMATSSQQFTNDQKLAEQEMSILKEFSLDPISVFVRVRNLPKNKEGEILYGPFQPVLKRLILDMKSRIGEEKIDQFYHEALQLLHDGIPYKATIRLVFRYLEHVDQFFLRLHPDLAGSFHRDNAGGVLENLLDRAPDIFIFPTFQEVDINFFLQTRSIPFHIVGLDLKGLQSGEQPPYADGFPMKPSEFAWHDLGHIEFMADRDFRYLDSTFKPLERVVNEWDFTRRRILSFLDSKKSNPHLHAAMQLILFEILHERGYQYSLAVLKAELDTPKWTEILERKQANNYFKRWPEINNALFAQLENARRSLFGFVEKMRYKDQKVYIEALHGTEISVRVTHFPKVHYGRGELKNIILKKSLEHTVELLKSDGHTIVLKISDLILAQVNPTVETPFDSESCERLEYILSRKDVDCIQVSSSKEISAILSNGQKTSLENLPSNDKKIQVEGRRLYFELEQVLGSYERNERISYTTQKHPIVYLSKIKYAADKKSIILEDGAVILPLSEVLIDPMQKEDFVSNI